MQVKTAATGKVRLHRHLVLDDNKRIFVVGDLDGDLSRLKIKLDEHNFDPSCDTLISLGDIIDRGAESVQLVRFMQEINAHVVLGNHEHMMLEALLSRDIYAMRLWVQNGGSWHFEVNDIRNLLDMCHWFKEQQLTITLDYRGYKIGFSHTLPASWDWENTPANPKDCIFQLLWDRERFQKRLHHNNHGVDFSIHGHNSTESPIWIGNSLHIDTAYYGMPTVMELSEVIALYSDSSAAII